MSNNDIAVSVRGLSKSYMIAHNAEKHSTMAESLMHRLRNPFQKVEKETFWALKDVSFDIQKGDVVGVIGRNGAGKSTLLKVLSRITEPTAGEIRLNGRVGSLLEVGTGFHPELTGRENIHLNGAILGMNRHDIGRQFEAIVEFAGVEKFLDTPVKRYSSGMYVRLAFAVAAHLNPEILVVDEVLAVGDADFQKKCLGKMKDVADSGRTVIFVSHNEPAMRRLCNSAILLKSGQIYETGTPDYVFKCYRPKPSHAHFHTENRTHSSPYIKTIDAELLVNHVVCTELASGVNPTLALTIKVSKAVKFSVELLIRDVNSIPIMFSPLGLHKGIEYFLEPGNHRLLYQLQLPYLASGMYSIDTILAETRISFYDYIEEAVLFNISDATNTRSGWPFMQSRGQGCVLLDVVEVTDSWK